MKTNSYTYGVKAQGKKELGKHIKGEKLTFKMAVLAKCYFCMNGYSDGKISCEITECPLYRFMPYKNEVETNA